MACRRQRHGRETRAPAARRTAKERIVGFYSTGPKLRPADIDIDRFFRRYCAEPVLVIIDVRPTASGVPTQAYVLRFALDLDAVSAACCVF